MEPTLLNKSIFEVQRIHSVQTEKKIVGTFSLVEVVCLLSKTKNNYYLVSSTSCRKKRKEKEKKLINCLFTVWVQKIGDQKFTPIFWGVNGMQVAEKAVQY